MSQLNAAFYCFAPLADLPRLREQWRPALEALGVKGTIILAPEGVNGFLAGSRSALEQALTLIREQPPLSCLEAKISESEQVPFDRLLLKLKPEIVTFRVPGSSPHEAPPAPRIQAEELAAWIEQKKDFVLLDTRNEYESRLGSFEGAHLPAIDHFVEFAAAAKELPESWKKKTVVSFCTGGIRCEKAAPYLQSLGFEKVLQLDGGILKYFEKVGGKGFRGECFVFDQRVALAPDLLPTGATLCSSCQGPIPAAASSCIHCQATKSS